MPAPGTTDRSPGQKSLPFLFIFPGCLCRPRTDCDPGFSSPRLTLPGGGVPACEKETENKFLHKPCVALQSAAGWGTGLPTPSGTGCHPGGVPGWWEVPWLGKQVPGGAQRCSDKGQGRAVQGKLRTSETHPGLPGRSHSGNFHGRVSLDAGCCGALGPVFILAT